jgi:Phr family secreted Rap phosphatase inhibitor
MKKLSVSLSCMVFLGTLAFGSNTLPTQGAKLKTIEKQAKIKVVDCTITAEAKIPGTNIGVTISSTRATCAEAARDVKAGIKALGEQ